MKIKEILYTSKFAHNLKKLSPEIQGQVIVKEKFFRENCFDARLKTHKLKGALDPLWSFSVNYSIRILFDFQTDGSIVFMDIGPHSIYK